MNNEIKTEQMATYEYLENQRKIWIADFKNKIINQIKN